MYDNFNATTLLMNSPVKLLVNEQDHYVFHIPSLKEGNDSLYFAQYLHFCKMDLDEFCEKCGQEKMSRLEFFKILLGEKQSLTCIANGLQMTIDSFRYEQGEFYCGNNVVDGIVFDKYIDFLLVGCGQKSMADYLQNKHDEENLSPEELEWERRKKENEKKIRDLKARQNKGGENDLELSLAAIMYEFHLSIEEISKLNIFTINFFSTQISKITSFDLNKRSAAAGLLKKGSKLSYWAYEK